MLFLILCGVIVAALIVTFIRTREFALLPEREHPPLPALPSAPTEHAAPLDLKAMTEGAAPDARMHEQWLRDMAANQRVYRWAERERGFEKYIEDIKAGRRQ